MKKYIESKKQNHSRYVVQNCAPIASWTPIAAILLTGIIGYLTYELFTHIPIIDYCGNGVVQIFG